LIIEPLKIAGIILAIIVPKPDLNFVTQVIRELTIITVQWMGHHVQGIRLINKVAEMWKRLKKKN